MAKERSNSRGTQILSFLWNVFLFSCFSTLFLFSLNEVNRDSSPDLVKPTWFVVLTGTLFGFIISVVNALPDRVNHERIDEHV